MIRHYPFCDCVFPIFSDRFAEGPDGIVRRMWDAGYYISVLYVEPASDIVSQVTT